MVGTLPHINLDRFQGAAPDDDRDDTFYCIHCGRSVDIGQLALWFYQPTSEGICYDCLDDWLEENPEEDEDE